MEADFSRYYGRDLGSVIWVDRWDASRLWSHVANLPEDSAFGRALSKGHTTLHELLAQVRDAVVTTAHGYRLEGRPKPYQRPGHEERRKEPVDPTNPDNAAEIRRFFGA